MGCQKSSRRATWFQRWLTCVSVWGIDHCVVFIVRKRGVRVLIIDTHEGWLTDDTLLSY